MRNLVIFLLLRLLSLIPLKFVFKITRGLLASKGFGSGSSLFFSGENIGLRVILGNCKDSPVVFDVGAYVGEYTEAVFETRMDCKAFIFEPARKTFDQLKNKLAVGKYANCHYKIFNFALGQQKGVATLHSDRDLSPLSSFSKRRLDHFKIEMKLREKVPVKTVDIVFSEQKLKKIDLLKIDVEGHELEVLKGAAKCFQKGKIRAVQFEFGGSAIDTRTYFQDYYYFFKKLGFDIFVLGPGGLTPINHYSLAYEYFFTSNYLAISSRPS